MMCAWCPNLAVVWNDYDLGACGPHHENLVLRVAVPNRAVRSSAPRGGQR